MGKEGRGRGTLDLACRGHEIIDIESLQRRDRVRRVSLDPTRNHREAGRTGRIDSTQTTTTRHEGSEHQAERRTAAAESPWEGHSKKYPGMTARVDQPGSSVGGSCHERRGHFTTSTGRVWASVAYVSKAG